MMTPALLGTLARSGVRVEVASRQTQPPRYRTGAP